MSNVTVVRRNTGFYQARNSLMEDPDLSYKAKGILVYMLGRAPGWDFSIDRIAKAGKEGREAVNSGIKELEAEGFLTRTKLTTGRMSYTLYEYREDNEAYLDTLGRANDGFSQVGKTRSLSNTDKKVIPIEKKRKKDKCEIVIENGKFIGDIQVLREVIFTDSCIPRGHYDLFTEVFPVLLEELQLSHWKTQAPGVNTYPGLEKYFLKRYSSKPKYWIFDYRSYTLWHYAGLPGGLLPCSAKLEALLENLVSNLKFEEGSVSIKEYADWYTGYAVERDWIPGWNSALAPGTIGIFTSQHLEEQYSSSSK